MNDDYLWQRSGEDPEIAALERALSGLSYRGSPPAIAPRSRRSRLGLLAAAAAVLLASGLSLIERPFLRDAATPASPADTPSTPAVAPPVPSSPAVASATPATPATGWPLTGTIGATRCGPGVAVDACRLAAGEWIESDERVRLEVADIGAIELEPHTRLGLLATGADEHRLRVARGTIHATVSAPPRLLVVETAGATAVDLGCSYTLSVDAEGAGWLAVETGAVALERPGSVVFVPAGARAETRPGRDPGVPYFTDAPDALQRAARDLSFGTLAPAALTAALRAARPRDSLSLWHLLPRVAAADRARVLRRLSALVPLGPDLARDELLRLDPDALERLRLRLEPAWS